MSVRSDVLNLVINVNGNQAQNQLNDLRKKASDISSEIKTLKKGTQEYIDANKNLREVNKEMSDLKQTIGITSLSMRELNAEKNKLFALRNASAPLSKEFKDYDTQLQAVIARQRELNSGLSGIKQTATASLGSVKQQLTSLVAGYIGVQALFSGIGKIITGSISLSDQLADLRRVAGLTADEAYRLNQTLLTFDTRTSDQGLLQIAIIAGKLGVAKKDIADFTQAVDKLVVTLGDELGGADEITTQLGKILNVFDGSITADNISHLGNSIVDLANKGVATGGFIVDFTQRVSGIAKASNISLGATVGFAAGLEGLGLRVESSSTAFQNLILKIGNDMPAAAKIAGISLKEFNALFAEQPQEALIKYAEGLVKNKKEFSDYAKSLKDAGDNQGKVAATLLAIGQNADFMRQQIHEGGKSIKEITALNEGFAIKNNDLAGSIEKVKKSLDKLVASKGVSSFLKGTVDELNGLLKSMTQISNVGLGEALERAAKGFSILVSQGYDAFKRYRLEQKELWGELTVTLPQDTATADGKPINQKKKNSTDTTNTTDNNPTTSDNYDSILNEAKSFYKSLQELKFQSEEASKSADQKELDNIKHKYEAIFQQYDALQKKLNKQDLGLLGPRSDISAAEQKELDAVISKQKQAAFEKDQQQIRDNLTKEYDAKKQQETLYYESLKETQGKRFADGEISYKTYQANLAAIDEKSNAALLQNAEDFAKQKVTINGKVVTAVEEAEKDMTAFQKAEFEKRIANAIRAAQAKKAEFQLLQNLSNQADLSKANTDVIIASSNNDPKAEAKAQKKLLDVQRNQKLEALDQEAADDKSKLQESGVARVALEKQIDDAIKVEKDKVNKQHTQDTLDVDNALYQKRIQMAQSFADASVSLFTSLNDALNNIENRKLQKATARNDKEKADLQKQLNSKLISQKNYDKKVSDLDAELDKKKQAIAVEQAKRQKALEIFSAITGTASAVVAALGSKPFGPWNIALAALVGALGAIQIGVIATEPLPTAGRGEWFREGDKHSDPSGGIPVMIERDEAVMKADAMTDRNKYTVTGTPSQITSKLNAIHGGVNWESGAQISLPKFMERPAQINADMPRIMAQGGTFRQSSNDTPLFSDLASQLIRIANSNDQIIDEIKNQKDRLHAVVSIKEYREKEKLYDGAKKASGMSQ